MRARERAQQVEHPYLTPAGRYNRGRTPADIRMQLEARVAWIAVLHIALRALEETNALALVGR